MRKKIIFGVEKSQVLIFYGRMNGVEWWE